MAEIDPYNKSQQLASEITSTTPQNQANPSKFYSGFLYKALIVTLFLAILPLFPSQAPEFINQTVFNRSWELLHLVFVGIAVSYGLFSRRNDETEKENHSKFDNAQSYVSRFLQVSSVFDEEVESPNGSGESKVQTWNSQYYRGKPVVVVTQESSVIDEQSSKGSRIGEKPLLLPVRSLKSRVSDPGDGESTNGDGGISRSLSWSSLNSGSKRFSINRSTIKNGELGGLEPLELEKKLEQNVVLPSPIPWRSRSGRMEMKEEVDSPPLYSLPPSVEEPKINKLESRSFRSQRSGSSHASSVSSSPKKLSPSPSFSSPKKPSLSPSLSSESQAKSVEDFARKKSFYKSTPPPPPPPHHHHPQFLV
ncbi:hypothetical protein CK203_009156 [Vitis vinifera]|uniref:Uncharacterized protein n=1 Tax=Vitis vinifera TaxID=29760 RepID=A0A438K372_VITVI|nr:hypothetical protein CK203_009156 [Vitis vinifera]